VDDPWLDAHGKGDVRHRSGGHQGDRPGVAHDGVDQKEDTIAWFGFLGPGREGDVSQPIFSVDVARRLLGAKQRPSATGIHRDILAQKLYDVQCVGQRLVDDLVARGGDDPLDGKLRRACRQHDGHHVIQAGVHVHDDAFHSEASIPGME
jgi:hypothetical protein